VLTRHLIARLAATALLAAGLVVTLNAAATADGGGSCPREIPWCTVTGNGNGGHGHGGGGGGSTSTGCYYKGLVVECYQPGLGYYNSSDHCYYNRLDPQPAADDPIWAAHDPAKGGFYEISCFDGPPPWGGASFGAVEKWIATPGGPSPRQLALRALAKIRLDGALIHMAPTTSTKGVGGLVGLPVWMWTTVNAHTWGPITSSASSGALTVRIVAKASEIVWTMGDGGKPVVCTQPGDAYAASDGGNASGDCGYTYIKPSYNQTNGRYVITATTTWNVTWQGGGDGGVITTTRTSRASVRINEQQVVVK
jgi:hypothetical protein